MLIKLTDLKDSTITTKAGNECDVKVVTGERIDNGETWERKVFMFNEKLIKQLADFGIGDNINVKMVQEGRFWNIDNFEVADDSYVETVRKNAKKNPSKGKEMAQSAGGGSSKMSKEEWAAKERRTKVGMSIHNAVAAASRLLKVGTKPEAVVEYAKELLPFLMLEELPEDKMSTEEMAELSGDDGALDPPKVD